MASAQIVVILYWIGIICLALICAHQSEEIECIELPQFRMRGTGIDTINGIPQCLYIRWKTSLVSSKHYSHVYDEWKRLHPNMAIAWFTHQLSDAFMDTYVPKRIRDCYYTLVPQSFRADLWRLCVLYLWGGIYVDHATQPLRSITYLMHKAPLIVAKDNIPGFIHNGFIIARPNNPHIAAYIDKIVDNVEARRYGQTPLCVTGPGAFGESLDPYRKLDVGINTTPHVYVLQHQFGPRQSIVDETGTVVVYKKYSFCNNIKDKLFNKNSYHRIWHRNELYAA